MMTEADNARIRRELGFDLIEHDPWYRIVEDLKAWPQETKNDELRSVEGMDQDKQT
ncbi:MAG TPA: hypothetical protein VFF75_04370 [Methylophilaceae bacterium]|nr:hypothetical protein [Methylophilaceae bacterium]